MMAAIANGIQIANNAERNNAQNHTQADKVKLMAHQIFEKKFQYQKHEGNWTIEKQNFFQEFYEFAALLNLEHHLNEEKSKLNDYDIVDWNAHTRKRDPSSEVVWKLKNVTKVEFGTVAWCKMYECLHQFPLVKSPRINSLHLCEAPGAFIAALNHYLHSTYNREEVAWKWLATTLNPYYEGNALSQMIADERFIRGTSDNWLFFEDFTGNIINRDNISQIERECKERLDNSVHFISADGSVDCWEKPDLQEETVSLLHWAEITTALSILADGGCFVLKMFTLFKAASVNKMFLLNCCFDSVHVFKPATSKQGNSEIYIICNAYRKNTPHLDSVLRLIKSKLEKEEVPKFLSAISLFGRNHLPKDFLMQHEVCVRLFMNYQINAIESNIYSYAFRHPSANYFVHLLRAEVTKQYYERYNIKALPAELKILKSQSASIENNKGLRIHKGSYSEKQNCDDMKVSSMFNDINELEKTLSLHTDMYYEIKSSKAVSDHVDDIHQYRSQKPISIVLSSLFTNMPMLLLYKKVLSEYNKNTAWEVETTCDINDDSLTVASWKDDGKSNFTMAQQQFFISVIDACATHRPAKVKFTNLLVLTHYSASLICYLSLHIFDDLIITSAGKGTITLTINDETQWESRMQKLRNVREILGDSHLFCIMRLSDLHGNEFSEALIQYNDRQLNRYINMMLTGL